MANGTHAPCTSDLNAAMELADTLIAISVITRRLARKIHQDAIQEQRKGETTHEQNE